VDGPSSRDGGDVESLQDLPLRTRIGTRQLSLLRARIGTNIEAVIFHAIAVFDHGRSWQVAIVVAHKVACTTSFGGREGGKEGEEGQR
jgi:hypothetical protein